MIAGPAARRSELRLLTPEVGYVFTRATARVSRSRDPRRPRERTQMAAVTETLAFGELEIAHDERVLTPRAWTLAQSEWASELLETLPPGRVLELCSGAGHIGLHAVLASGRSLVCVDDDPAACDFIRLNAAAAGMPGRVEVRQARLADAVAPDERFALVIADPPWVPSDSVGLFPEDPVHAIDGGPDGLALVDACLEVAAAHLADDGELLLQVGPGQEAWVEGRAAAHGLLARGVRRVGQRGSLVLLGREGSS